LEEFAFDCSIFKKTKKTKKTKKKTLYFLCFSKVGKRWEQIKMTKNAKINPGSLHGHAAVIFKSNK